MTLDDLLREPEPRTVIERPPPRPREGATVTAPNGWVIEFLTKPYRHYKIDGEKVVSVSQVTSCLDKPQLPWWAMRVGTVGVVELIRRGELELLPGGVLVATNDVVNKHGETIAERGEPLEFGHTVDNDKDPVARLLTIEKLTSNHVKQEAADRGSRVHDAMEDWAQTGELPNPEDAPEDEQGYIEGLRLFIVESGLEPAGVEMIVGSKAHKVAGRSDVLNGLIPKPFVGCVKIDYKTGDETRTLIPSGRWLVDLKTSSGVWKEAHFQVAGYEGLGVECGHPPTDYQGILRVTADGRYEFVESVATFDDFLAVMLAFEATKRYEKVAA